MATIAELLVRLGMDASGLKSGASQAKGELSSLKASFKKVEQAGKTMANIGKSITMGVTLPLAGAAAALVSFGAKAESALQIEDSFNRVSESAGTMGDEMLAALQKSSRGLISNTDLMKNFNLASQLVGKEFAVNLPEAMGYLGKVSAATGESMDYMMTSMVRGIGRLSPLILDNLGIQVDLAQAYEDYAASVGKSTDELSKSEQQTAATIQVMRLLKENTASMSDEFGTTGDRIKAAMENAKVAIGTNLVGALQGAGDALVPLIGNFSKLFDEGESLHPVITTVKDSMSKLVEFIGKVTEGLSNLSPAWAQTIIDIGLFVAALGPILIVGGKVVTTIGKIGSALLSIATNMLGAGAAATAMVGPLGLAIAAIVAVGVAAIKHKNDVKEFADGLNEARNAAVAAGQPYEEYARNVENIGHTVEEANFNLTMHQGSLKDTRDALLTLRDASIITEKEYGTLRYGVDTGTISVNEAQAAIYKFVERQRDLAIASDLSAESLIEQSIAQAQLATNLGLSAYETGVLAEAMKTADDLYKEAFDSTTSLSANMGNMIQYAHSYDSIQGQMNAKLEELIPLLSDVNGDGLVDMADAAGNTSSKVQGLVGDYEALGGALDALADQAALNMLQQTLAIDGWTKAEAKLFFDTAVEMGNMTQAGADAAYASFENMVDTANLLEIVPKDIELTVDDAQAIADIIAADNMTIEEKEAAIKVILKDLDYVVSQIKAAAQNRSMTITVNQVLGSVVNLKADGGPVQKNKLYVVGERGPEFFVPNQNGEIIPNHKLNSVTNNALGDGASGGTMVTNNYNLTMPTTANAGDMQMAFSLMEAWGT